jgi:ABC-2 type transport system ATP-binding protein
MQPALLVSLAPRPEILIMDEPFTGMDALVKDELVEGLLELAGGGDWTVLVCSHDIGRLELLADHVGFLDRGRLILSEPIELLADRFRHVEVTLDPGALTSPGDLPPTWLSPKRSGRRLTFVSCDHGADGWESEVKANLPGAGGIQVERASLRDVFVTLAAEGLGGRDWGRDGGLA